MGNGSLSLVYGVLALLSALLFVAYLLFAQRKNRLFLALFGCVALSNSGYFLLAICQSLTVAKLANGLSYFGGAFSILLMFLIIYEVCRMKKRPWLRNLLVVVSICVCAVASSGDWLGLYYRSMSLETVDGMTRLVKEYGPLHSLYALYLLCYVVMMVVIIVYASRAKRLAAPKYTLFLLVAVLLNVGVWLVEQLMHEQFPEIVDLDFTAHMEKNLDGVENGQADWVQVLDAFYGGFVQSLKRAEENLEKVKVPEIESDEVCERCGRRMVVKTGRYGKFLACPGYPECKNTKRIVESTEGLCPKCNSPIEAKKSKNNRKFFGCSRYPACDFATWNEPTKEVCPQCGKTLFRKKGKNAGVFCLTEGCAYEK